MGMTEEGKVGALRDPVTGSSGSNWLGRGRHRTALCRCGSIGCLDPPPVDLPSAEWEGRLIGEVAPLGARDFLRQPYRGSKVRILAHDDGGVTPFLVGRADPSPVNLNPLALQTPEFVVPEAIPEGIGPLGRHSRVEADFLERPPGFEVGQGLRQHHHVVTRPRVRRGRSPSFLGKVKEVLTVDQDYGAHGKKHPPGDKAKTRSSGRGVDEPTLPRYKLVVKIPSKNSR